MVIRVCVQTDFQARTVKSTSMNALLLLAPTAALVLMGLVVTVAPVSSAILVSSVRTTLTNVLPTLAKTAALVLMP
jgi:hypothetical protein